MSKCLIINNKYESIPETIKDDIIDNIEEKRKYKHNLFDYLNYILSECTSSKEIHQEIGLYLGVPKYKLNKIYKTRKGDLVASKSEMIIADLLYAEKINYCYEKPLFYPGCDKPIHPDFTIFINDREYYWEHVGMLGDEKYNKDWLFKLDIYGRHYSGQLRKTLEGTRITDASIEVINNLKSL